MPTPIEPTPASNAITPGPTNLPSPVDTPTERPSAKPPHTPPHLPRPSEISTPTATNTNPLVPPTTALAHSTTATENPTATPTTTANETTTDPPSRESSITFKGSQDFAIDYRRNFAPSSLSKILSTEALLASQKSYKNDPTLPSAISLLACCVLQFHQVYDPDYYSLETQLPFKWWYDTFLMLFKAKSLPTHDLDSIRRPNDPDSIRLCICRLARTHPKHIIPSPELDQTAGVINNPGHTAKAFWAACCVLGTLFRHPTTSSSHQTSMDTFVSRSASATNAASLNSSHVTTTTTTVHPLSISNEPMDIDSIQPPPPPPATQTTPKITSAKTTPSSFTQVPSKTKTKSLTKRIEQLSKCRVKYSLQLPVKKDIPTPVLQILKASDASVSAFAYTRYLIQEIFSMYRGDQGDPEVFLLPWSDSSKAKIIGSPLDIPTSPADLKIYAHGFRAPTLGKTVWFSLRFSYGTQGPGINNFPNYNGTHQAWFTENKHSANLHCLHDSEYEINLGYLRFTGPFLDLTRIQASFHEAYKGHSTVIGDNALGTFKMGLQVKNILKPDNVKKPDPLPTDINTSLCTAFPNQAHRPIAVICDQKHAHACKNKLMDLFSNRKSFLDRPGQYDCDFLPSPAYLMTGNGGPSKTTTDSTTISTHQKLQEKHLGSAGKMAILTTNCLQNLDTLVEVDYPKGMISAPYMYSLSKKYNFKTQNDFPSALTLREILLTLPFPLRDGGPTLEELAKTNRTFPNHSDRLFHSVDLNTSAFSPLDQYQVKFTCFTSRLHVATAFIAALPSFVQEFYAKGTDVWIQSSHLMNTYACDFKYNDMGLWTGEWSSPDDQLLSDMLDYDLPNDYSPSNEAPTTSTSIDSNLFSRPILLEKDTPTTATAVPTSKPIDEDTSDDDITVASRHTTASMISSNSLPPSSHPLTTSHVTAMSIDQTDPPLPPSSPSEQSVMSTLTQVSKVAQFSEFNPSDMASSPGPSGQSVASDTTTLSKVTHQTAFNRDALDSPPCPSGQSVASDTTNLSKVAPPSVFNPDHLTDIFPTTVDTSTTPPTVDTPIVDTSPPTTTTPMIESSPSRPSYAAALLTGTSSTLSPTHPNNLLLSQLTDATVESLQFHGHATSMEPSASSSSSSAEDNDDTSKSSANSKKRTRTSITRSQAASSTTELSPTPTRRSQRKQKKERRTAKARDATRGRSNWKSKPGTDGAPPDHVV